MKLLLSFVVISVANAASQNGSFIRGGSSAADEAAATHVVPGDIFAGLLSNNWTPDQYCPNDSPYNKNGSEWPPEDGCYPGTGSIPAGYPKCCDKGNCPNNGRPLCENSMSDAPAYCADMGPDPSCYQLSWPACCVNNGPSCPSNPPPCDKNGNRRTCNSSSQCLSDEFCMKQDFNCDQIGQCVIMPSQCSNNYDPVCGCDNKTYDNACLASVQGRTTVKYNGKCSGNRNTCNSNSGCQSDEFCNFPFGDCGDSGNGGECMPIPSGSDCAGFPNDKVCGCDNVQYKNSCKANQSRTSIQNMGNCLNEDFAFE